MIAKIDEVEPGPWTGYSLKKDWDIPTPEEFALMYINRKFLNLTTGTYWTNDSTNNLMAVSCSVGERLLIEQAYKQTSMNVRLIKRL